MWFPGAALDQLARVRWRGPFYQEGTVQFVRGFPRGMTLAHRTPTQLKVLLNWSIFDGDSTLPRLHRRGVCVSHCALCSPYCTASHPGCSLIWSPRFGMFMMRLGLSFVVATGLT